MPDEDPELPTYHPKFYIQEGMATFLVENRLFKIHHHFLVRESEKFRSIIMRPRAPSDNIIMLPDVTCHEFECLLDFFYNGMHDDYGPAFREWLALLSIATRFGMDKIRRGVIFQIESQPFEMDPIEKILLAKLHGIDGWLAPAYADLCLRAEPLQGWEAEKLGLAVTVMLAQAREKFRAVPGPCDKNDRRGGLSPRPADSEPAVPHGHPTRALGIVNDIFWPPKFAEPRTAEGTENGGTSVGIVYGKKVKKCVYK
jgi:hypothetical protein